MNVLDIMSSSLPPSQPPSTSTSPSTSSTSKSISLCPPVVKADVGTHVRVGVGVVVKDPNNPHHIFCGIRKGSHGAGTLALPGYVKNQNKRSTINAHVLRTPLRGN